MLSLWSAATGVRTSLRAGAPVPAEKPPLPQVKKLVYVYLVRYAEEQQDLALLSISTFQRGLPNGHALTLTQGLPSRGPLLLPLQPQHSPPVPQHRLLTPGDLQPALYFCNSAVSTALHEWSRVVHAFGDVSTRHPAGLCRAIQGWGLSK